MKNSLYGALFIIFTTACQLHSHQEIPKKTPPAIQGTWKLISGTLIENGDTSVTDYTKNLSFIKIINDTHFAFLSHDLHQGKGADSAFSAGGGTCRLVDSLYTEWLEYCSDRQWEGNDFSFVIAIHNDTLTQIGVEKVSKVGINRLNIEKYYRLQN